MTTEYTQSSVNESIGYRIFRKRKEQGWSGQQLAQCLGISQQQFSRYERGRSPINVSLLVKAAEILQTPVGWFMADCSDGLSYREAVRAKADMYTSELLPEYGLSVPSRYNRRKNEVRQT